MANITTWIGWAVALLATIVAIRATVRFDLNAWLKDRSEAREERLKKLCPHVYLDMQDGQPAVGSYFVSPPGTTTWRCEQCGATVNSEQFVHDTIKFWAANPDKLLEREKKFRVLAKKIGYID